MTRKKICLVEDDEELAALVCEYLTKHEYEVCIVDNGTEAVEKISIHSPDMIILDLMLPGKDGISICREIRPSFSGPIMMLTASDETVDQIVGLEIGADDFVSKPVEPRVLLARIRSLLRRYENRPTENDKETRLLNGDLIIDSRNREVTKGKKLIELNTQEFDLLEILVRRSGEIITRDELFNQIKGYAYDGQNRFIDILISQLRQKLNDDEAELIKTIRGKGYLLKER